ncbi:hypothetical protein HMPREF0724_14226 [Prescottella equi ATCC 33707]|uniref:Uncharacterized protein n=1 Tax=Prescottella equi ATCC 33707 TaxID=525370 RepID=E9T620_RHOHA|nr:hypothetical protein HMPREF0724_14226 [Prescottella equi ATCC 33707]
MSGFDCSARDRKVSANESVGASAWFTRTPATAHRRRICWVAVRPNRTRHRILGAI